MRNERGAIIIHVAIALVALLLFAGFVVDHGAWLVARGQAQAGADAGALAGAGSLITDPGNLPLARQTASTFGTQQAVWGQATAPADVVVSPLPWNCPDGSASCIRVDVLRGLPDHDGNTHNNTLPTFMMHIAGINSQGTRATATAEVAAGNIVRCIKPWIVADRWNDHSGTGLNTSGWDQMDFFNPGVDTYNTATTGFNAQQDVGLELMMKGDGNDWSAGWSLEIDLNGGNGGNVYRDEIGGCPAWVPSIGLYQPPDVCAGPPDTNLPQGCINVKTGVKQGPTTQGVGTLVNLDLGATWDRTNNVVTGGCTSAGNCGTVNPLGIGISPRIVPIALFDPQAYADGGFNGNGGMARVVNLLGFFIEGMCSDVYATPPAWCGSHPDQVVTGRLMNYPGSSNGTASGPAGPGTFIKVVRLVQ